MSDLTLPFHSSSTWLIISSDVLSDASWTIIGSSPLMTLTIVCGIFELFCLRRGVFLCFFLFDSFFGAIFFCFFIAFRLLIR